MWETLVWSLFLPPLFYLAPFPSITRIPEKVRLVISGPSLHFSADPRLVLPLFRASCEEAALFMRLP